MANQTQVGLITVLNERIKAVLEEGAADVVKVAEHRDALCDLARASELRKARLEELYAARNDLLAAFDEARPDSGS